MAGCPQEALNLLIVLWKQRLLCVPHVILSQIATENIETMRENTGIQQRWRNDV